MTIQHIARVLAAGAAGVVLTALPAAPVRADLGRTIVVGPVVARPVVIVKMADLRLETFEVTAVGGGKWKLKATLRNGSVNPTDLRQTYPGGGWLVISRTSGGTNPVPPPADPFSAVPDLGQQLKKVSIPALANGAAITAEVITTGRAIFTAAATAGPPVVDGPTPTLPEIDKNNNSKTVNKLIPLNLTINSSLLQTFLGPVLDDFQVHLHKTNSYIRLPGMFEKHFDIPQVKKGLPWPLGDAYWYVNDINLQRTTIAISGGGLALSFKFETSGDEIVGWVDGGPDWLAPNVNGSPLEVHVKLPLAYNAWAQFFYYTTPQVWVNAHWSLNGPLPDSLVPDINGRIASAMKELLSNDMVRAKLEYELNRQIRTQLLKGGRIVSASIQPSHVQMSVEVGG